jgi:aryl-alcohol dehydrogenase-like predicted oxidoreductase
MLSRPLKASETTKRGETDWMVRGYLQGAGTEKIITAVEEVAKKRGVSMAQVATAWSLSKDGAYFMYRILILLLNATYSSQALRLRS